ncbi:MAG: HAD-IA family hydrolase [Gemmatimonadaceae bacterium]
MSAASLLRCSAVLFDLDGVLVDSAECVERTWRGWAVQHNLDPAHVIEFAHGRRTIETIGLVAPHLSAADEARTLEANDPMTTNGIYEVRGARRLVEGLPPDTWAIVTSGVRAVATLRIRHTGLPMPSVLVCADEIQRGKPDPEGYLLAARRLGYSPAECVVVEDAPPGIEAAHNGGMRAVAISATYPSAALQSADLIVPSLAALRMTTMASGLEITVASSD